MNKKYLYLIKKRVRISWEWEAEASLHIPWCKRIKYHIRESWSWWGGGGGGGAGSECGVTESEAV